MAITKDMYILLKQQCLLFYSDILSILTGLLHDQDKRKYAVYVIWKKKRKSVVFSSRILNETHLDNNQWIEDSGVYNAFDIAFIGYKPFISEDIDFEFDGREGISQYFYKQHEDNSLVFTHKVYSSLIENSFEIILVIEGLKRHFPLTPLLDDLTSRCIVKWRDCFRNGEISKNSLSEGLLILRPNGSDAIAMLHSHPDYLKKALYFNVITKISSEYYEKKKSHGTIVVIPKKNQSSYIPLDEIDLNNSNIRYLRKLLEMTNDKYSLLVDKYAVYGIGIPERYETEFIIKGHLEWDMFVKGIPILSYKCGDFFVSYNWDENDFLSDAYFDTISLEEKSRISNIVKQVWDFQIGALLLFVPNASDEAKRLSGYKRGHYLEDPINLIDENQKEILRAITAIDGAVLLDVNCMVHGYGIILDGDAKIAGNIARGARYNSPKNYLNRYIKELEEPKFAVVISDDKTIDVLFADKPEKLQE